MDTPASAALTAFATTSIAAAAVPTALAAALATAALAAALATATLAAAALAAAQPAATKSTAQPAAALAAASAAAAAFASTVRASTLLVAARECWTLVYRRLRRRWAAMRSWLDCHATKRGRSTVRDPSTLGHDRSRAPELRKLSRNHKLRITRRVLHWR